MNLWTYSTRKNENEKPELVFLNCTLSAWFICLPTFGGGPLLLRIIKRNDELLVIDRYTDLKGKAVDIIRLWFPLPPDENGKVY